MLTKIVLAFLVGGLICLFVQILIDLTKLTPARILVGLVCLGVLLGAVGIYDRIFAVVGCGISLPLLGFGGTIARGVREQIAEYGAFGILTAPFTAAAAGCSAALIFGYLSALIFRGHPKDA